MTAYPTSRPKTQGHTYLPNFAQPERNYDMENFGTIDSNTSNSEVLKKALYGGYTRFELELEVRFHFDFLPKYVHNYVLLTHTYIVCPVPFKPFLPELSCLAKASTRSQFHHLPQIPAILYYTRVHQVPVIPRSNAQSSGTPAAREVPPGYFKPRCSRKAGTKWLTSNFWREVNCGKHMPCGGRLFIRLCEFAFLAFKPSKLLLQRYGNLGFLSTSRS